VADDKRPRFARTLRADLAAVQAGLTSQHSTGQTRKATSSA
jgi:hypothetical protein